MVVASLSGLLFGYDTGVVSGALLFLKIQYHLSPTMQEVVTSVVLVGAVIGAAGSGRMADRLGRRVLMIATAAIFLIGVLITAFAPDVAVLIGGRIVVGVGIGIASYLGPLYISEISPSDIRGGLVAINQLLLTLGILLSYFVDYGLSSSGDWRLMFGLAVVPALLLGVGMMFLPESPRWLVAQGSIDEATRALKRFNDRGKVAYDARRTRVTAVASNVPMVIDGALKTAAIFFSVAAVNRMSDRSRDQNFRYRLEPSVGAELK